MRQTKFTLKKSWRIVMLFAAIAALVVWFGQPQSSTTVTQDALPQADLVTMDGVFGIIHSDDEGFTEADVDYFLNTEDDIYELAMPDAHADAPLIWNGYNGQAIIVDGRWLDADPTRSDDLPVLDVINIRPDTDAMADDVQQGVTGNTRWVNIACRFGDMTDTTPQPMSYFEEMMLNIAPGMDHYWRATSDDLVNIEGSASYGWYDLPKDKATYLRAASANTGFALRQLLTDCAQAAATNDGVDFSQFGGINVMLNDTFGCCAWGGRMPLNVDGKLVQFRTTWLPPWAFNSLHVIAHEMGHGWGLPHSSGPYGKVYDSAWDVMSGGTRMLDFCRIGREPVGCYQVGTIGFHLAMLGWLPEDRIVTVRSGESMEIRLDALTTVGSTSEGLLVLVPIAGRNEFYTVEVRSFVNYDRNVPGEAVVLHHVNPNRQSPALVVDGDNNGDPNDEGAMWLPGETFTDSRVGIKVEVISQLGTTFTVRVSN